MTSKIKELIEAPQIAGETSFQRVAAAEGIDEPASAPLVNLAKDYAARLEEARGETSLAATLEQRFRHAAVDLVALPLNTGRARPSDEEYMEVDTALEEAGADLSLLATELIEAVNPASLAQAYNAVRVYEPGRAETIMTAVRTSAPLQRVVNLITDLHAKAISEMNLAPADPRAEAEQDVNKVLVFDASFKYFNVLKPARALINRFRTTLFVHFFEVFKRKAAEGMPLSKGGKPLDAKELEFLNTGMELSQKMFDMDELSKRDLLSHPLGQAITAAAGKGYNYTKKLEEERLGAPTATYGFIFLSEEQAKGLKLLPDAETYSAEFSHFGKPYYAVPYGRYCLAKKPQEFGAMLQTVKDIETMYPDTPVAEYAQALHRYLSYGNQAGSAAEYSKICYDAECAWVRYVRYATANGMPFIFAHPFEQYTVTSIKDHDLALCPVAVEGQDVATELQGVFAKNLKTFFDREGILGRYPEMCATVLERIPTISMTLLDARFAATMPGILAQTVPNYEPGQKEGLVILGDYAYGLNNDRAITNNNVKSADPLGGFAEFIAGMSDQAYTQFYVKALLGHEIGHHIYRGKEQKGVESDEKGLSLGEVEEAKASHGVLFAVENPRDLKPEEVEQLRKVIPFMLELDGIGRLTPNRLKNFRNDMYVRSGAIFIDYALKVGMLEVVHVKLEGNGENYRILLGEDKKDADTAFLRLHLEDEKIRGFAARMASSWLSWLSPITKFLASNLTEKRL